MRHVLCEESALEEEHCDCGAVWDCASILRASWQARCVFSAACYPAMLLNAQIAERNGERLFDHDRLGAVDLLRSS